MCEHKRVLMGMWIEFGEYRAMVLIVSAGQGCSDFWVAILTCLSSDFSVSLTLVLNRIEKWLDTAGWPRVCFQKYSLVPLQPIEAHGQVARNQSAAL
jgi:hypothetical protein